MGFEFKGLGPCGFVWISFCGLVLVVPVYTSCVLRSVLRFLIKLFLLIQKKKRLLTCKHIPPINQMIFKIILHPIPNETQLKSLKSISHSNK
jgi:hypothetical protein